MARQISTSCFPAGVSFSTLASGSRRKAVIRDDPSCLVNYLRRLIQMPPDAFSRPRNMFSATVRWGARSDS